MMKKRLIALVFVLIMIAVAGGGCGPREPSAGKAPTATPGGGASLANPAAVYCKEKGYVSQIRTAADGGQYGVCIFPDGTECDEWAFFRGECGPGAKPMATPTQLK